MIRTAQEAIKAAARIVDVLISDLRTRADLLRRSRAFAHASAMTDAADNAVIAAEMIRQIEIAPVAAGEFALVPREPTEAMLWAAEESKPTSVGSGFDNSHSYRRRVIKALWQEMLSAAPPPPAPESEVERLREALERIRDLSPRKANANTAVDLFLTVRAIADSALAALNPGGDGK